MSGVRDRLERLRARRGVWQDIELHIDRDHRTIVKDIRVRVDQRGRKRARPVIDPTEAKGGAS